MNLSSDLSPDTQAALLLAAPLRIGNRQLTAKPLTPSEHKRLVVALSDEGYSPADLLGPDAPHVLSRLQAVIDVSRLEKLLSRGMLLALAVEHWRSRAIWVISRGEPAYPRRLLERLGEDAPVLLYGCGDISIAAIGGLAVVGSRAVAPSLIAHTEEVGRLVSKAGRVVISGGARGIDRAAMQGALNSGGRAVGVLANGLDGEAIAGRNRDALIENRLALISPNDPRTPFHAGLAMQRNKLIYALADAALVVESDFERGGTYSGAMEQLRKFHFAPVFVRSDGELGAGLHALLENGAREWPEGISFVDLPGLLDRSARKRESVGVQGSLLEVMDDGAQGYQARPRST